MNLNTHLRISSLPPAYPVGVPIARPMSTPIKNMHAHEDFLLLSIFSATSYAAVRNGGFADRA